MLLEPGSVVLNSHTLRVGIVEGWNVRSFDIATKNLFGQLFYIAKNRGRTSNYKLNSRATVTAGVNIKIRDVNSKSIFNDLLTKNWINYIKLVIT